MSEKGSPAPAAPKPLMIRVIDQSGNEIQFKIKSTTQFKKVFTAYSAQSGKDLQSCRFLFDGVRVVPEQCPADYEMEDDDSIEVVQEQIGGGSGGMYM